MVKSETSPFFYPRLTRPLYLGSVFLLIVGITAGCSSYSNLQSGNELFEQGKFELAAQQYDHFLQANPRNEQALYRRAVSQQRLDVWLNQLALAAEEAYDHEEKSLALILYGKLLQAGRGSLLIEQRFGQLRSDIRSKNILFVSLEYSQNELGDRLDRKFPGTDVLPPSAESPSSLRHLSIELGDTTVEQNQWESRKSEEFISGVVLVPNPEIPKILARIDSSVERLNEALDDEYRYLGYIKEYEDELERLWSSSEENTGIAIPELLRKLRRAREKLRDYQDSADARQDQLFRQRRNLYNEPEYIEEDVYSFHDYTVLNSTLRMSAQLRISENGQEESYSVQAIHNDIGHSAQAVLNLLENPITHVSTEQLKEQLLNEASDTVSRHIAAMVRENRAPILRRVNAADSLDEEIIGMITYALSGDSWLSPEHADQLEQNLAFRFGDTGLFHVNELLFLTQDY